MIDYRQLQALAAVIERGSFERAAQMLCLTQSAISHRIKQLESLMGQPVLLRTSPVRATLAGQRLLNHLQQVKQMESALGLTDESAEMVIRLATNADSLATWLPEALVLPEHSAVSFDLVVEDQSVGLKRMKQGEVMACVCADAYPVNGGRSQRLGALRYQAVASPAFIRRFGLQDDLTARLSQAPCLVFNQDDKLQHQYMADIASAEPQIIHRCPSSEGFLRAVVAGLGFGLLPQLQMQPYLDSGQLVDLTPDYHLDTPLFWHYWQTESPMLNYLRKNVMAVARHYLWQ